MKLGSVLLLLLLLAVVLSGLAVVYSRHEHRQLFVQLSQLEKERDELNIEFGRLQLEQATWADPNRIAILDNFCWGNTERPETLGSLVRAALGCKDTAIAFGTPFISGKDSLNNEFSYVDANGQKQTVAIPSSLLISAMAVMDDAVDCRQSWPEQP